MTEPGIFTRLWPTPSVTSDDDDALLAWYETHELQRFLASGASWVRVNFVSSVDGSATLGERSGTLSTAPDKRVFSLLRRAADVIVVGSGTIREEGYGKLSLDDESVQWRRRHGYADQPTLAIVSNRADFDPDDRVFAAPVRPLVVTTVAAEQNADRLRGVADVVVAGRTSVDPVLMLRELTARGLRRVHGEGGPKVFGEWVAADIVDELTLTVSPVLVGGAGMRVTGSSSEEVTRRMRIAGALLSEETLLLRYVRGRGEDQA